VEDNHSRRVRDTDEEVPQVRTFPVPIPFGGEGPLVLEPTAAGARGDAELTHLVTFMPRDEEELARIMTAAVILFHAKAGTFGECLRTAVIWERG